jgi:hypothetical protein
MQVAMAGLRLVPSCSAGDRLSRSLTESGEG